MFLKNIGVTFCTKLTLCKTVVGIWVALPVKLATCSCKEKKAKC